jgi:hypothetical protein
LEIPPLKDNREVGVQHAELFNDGSPSRAAQVRHLLIKDVIRYYLWVVKPSRGSVDEVGCACE